MSSSHITFSAVPSAKISLPGTKRLCSSRIPMSHLESTSFRSHCHKLFGCILCQRRYVRLILGFVRGWFNPAWRRMRWTVMWQRSTPFLFRWPAIRWGHNPVSYRSCVMASATFRGGAVGFVRFFGFVYEVSVASVLVAFPPVVEGSSRGLSCGADLRSMAPQDDDVQLLMTVPGIGYHAALLAKSEIRNIKRFPNEEKLCSYVGLVPPVSSSGRHRRLVSLTKEG